MVTKLQVDYLVRARQLALTGHYPHLTDLHQVLDLDYSDDDDDDADADGDSDNDIISYQLNLK